MALALFALRPDAWAQDIAIVIYLALVGWTAYAVYLLAKRPMPGAVPRAVGALIAGISLVDATFLAGIGAIMPALRRGRRLSPPPCCCSVTSRGRSMKPCADFLLGVLSRALAPDALAWLNGEIDRQRAAADERRLRDRAWPCEPQGRPRGAVADCRGNCDRTAAARLAGSRNCGAPMKPRAS